MNNETLPPRLLSWGRHRSWSWRRSTDYSFARCWRTVPVTMHEATDAASCFPLVFLSEPSGLMPHALLRVGRDGESVFVARDGRWQAAWLPVQLQAWPFGVVVLENGDHALALHEGSACVSDGPGQLPIFAGNDGSSLAPEAAAIARLLQSCAEAAAATSGACGLLRSLGLLRAFEADTGMLEVAPDRVASLGEAEVIQLHRAGALGLVHAAVISRSHLAWMTKAERWLSSAPPRVPRASRRDGPGAVAGFLAALAAADAADEASLGVSGLKQACDWPSGSPFS